MAVEKNIEFKGIIITNAYCKIISLNGNKDSIFYTVGVFTSKDKAENLNNNILSFSYSFVPNQDQDAPRWDKQCYENLRTQAEFIDAVDLLDETTT